MIGNSEAQKSKHVSQHQVLQGRANNKHLEKQSYFISMREARQIAEHVLSGIAWSG